MRPTPTVAAAASATMSSCRKAGADGVRMAAQLLRLLEEKALEQLDLGAHGNVLADRHREGAGGEAGESCQPHEGGRRFRRADAEDHRDVGDETVADAEDRCSRRAALYVGGALPGDIGGDRLDLFGH